MNHIPSTPGLHHVTAMASDPARNLRFYTEVLAQRLVKRTVNFDDTGTYHLYYGDEVGQPGTSLTFFPWPNAKRGAVGTGETAVVAYAVRDTAVGAWAERLREHGVEPERFQRWGRPVVRFHDPDGIALELVGRTAPPEVRPWSGTPVPDELQLRGFESVTLDLVEAAPTIELLAAMGYELVQQGEDGEATRFRLETEAGGVGGAIELLEHGHQRPSRLGVGSIHHIAFRVRDDAAQSAAREALLERGFDVTEVRDRQYFRSIYFREPGGVLFEIATDTPGFTADEPVESLGSGLRLPPWFEEERERIEASLPVLPKGAGRAATEATP